jgi:hypothetical protein
VPASTLINDPEMLATSLLSFTTRGEAVARLKPIRWTDVGEAVYAARWRVMSHQFAASLALFSIDSLPVGEAETVEAGRRLVLAGQTRLVDRDDAHRRAIEVLIAALGVCLMDHGWVVRKAVGEPLLLVRNSEIIDPVAVVVGLSNKSMNPEEWKGRCAALGLAGCSLGPER